MKRVSVYWAPVRVKLFPPGGPPHTCHVIGSCGTYVHKDSRATKAELVREAVDGYRDLIQFARDRKISPSSWEVGNRYTFDNLAAIAQAYTAAGLECYACKYGVSARRVHRNCPKAVK